MLSFLVKFIAQLGAADNSIKENSILGESRFDREHHSVWGICRLIVLLITAASGLTWWWG